MQMEHKKEAIDIYSHMFLIEIFPFQLVATAVVYDHIISGKLKLVGNVR